MSDTDTGLSELATLMRDHGHELATQISNDSASAMLSVVRRMARQADDAIELRDGMIRLARQLGATLTDIAEAAGVAPQTVANICKRG
jgi:hypothetical protein